MLILFPTGVFLFKWIRSFQHPQDQVLVSSERCLFIPLHHVILLKALLRSYELNTLDACWIAVDVWSNSSRCRQESVYLSRL